MRRRLALLSLAVTSLVVLAFIVPLALLVRNQAADRALSDAERDAQALAAALAVVGRSEAGPAVVTEEAAQAVIDALPREVSIIFPDGAHRGAPYAASPNIERAREGRAFTAYTAGGAEVLVPIVAADGPDAANTVVVRAFVPESELTEGVLVAWALLAGLGVFLVIVAVVAADRLGRSIVRPVSALSVAARRLGGGNLDTRVDPAGPREVAEVGEAFNFLAGRLGALLDAERETVADLSHRLRTPLTALRLQAETLRDEEESAALLQDVGNVEQAVDRLIHEARRTPGADGEPAWCDLARVVRHRAAFWRVLADEQGRPAVVETAPGLHVALGADELGALIDTLIENVFAHTPPGTGYRIGAASAGRGFVRLVVEDDGPGFDGEAVVARGTSGAGSTGLGLDIARKAAQRTGGDITVATSGSGGARVDVLLGGPRRRPEE